MSKINKEDRIKEVIEALKEMSIEEVTEMLGYKNTKVLQTMMNRYGYRWSAKDNTFLKKREDNNKPYTPPASTLIGKIILELEKNKGNLKNVIQITNFKTVSELAKYMQENNYKWDSSINNYVQIALAEPNSKGKRKDKDKIKNDTSIISSKEIQQEFIENVQVNNEAYNLNTEQILNFIKNNKDEVREILQGSYTGNIPRYCVPGRNITKSLYMVDRVADLISKYSYEKHISQREIATIAFIEFFKKYGYKHEIENIFL